jgi:Flp pilus assembly protein TadG
MRRDDRGAASLEFALVVPVLILLLTITGYFAWAFYAESQLERAAQRAARYAAVPTTSGGYAYRHCDVVATVNRQLVSDEVPPGAVAVRDADGPLAATTCPGSTAAGRPHGYVRVRVTRTVDNPFTDVLRAFFRRTDPWTVTGSGEARVEDAP